VHRLGLLLSFGEPGEFQAQVALQPPAGGGADGAGIDQPGQFGVFGSDEVCAQFPFGRGCFLVLSGGTPPRNQTVTNRLQAGRYGLSESLGS
jgi:hypothetical protein